MAQQNSSLVKTFSFIGIFFGALALIISFLPLRMFAIIPGTIGLLLGLGAYLIAKKQNTSKKMIFAVLIISGLSIAIAAGTQLFSKNEVAKDEKFEEKIEKNQDEIKNDLDDALKDLKKDEEKK